MALEGRSFKAFEAAPSEPGSIEWVLRRTGLPRLVLDVEDASSAPQGEWLTSKLNIRSVGARYFYNAQQSVNVAKRFDGLITSTRRLPPGFLK